MQDTNTTFDDFVSRHNGPRPEDVAVMLETLGYATLDDLIAATIPAGIRLGTPLQLPPPQSERDALDALRRIASQKPT